MRMRLRLASLPEDPIERFNIRIISSFQKDRSISKFHSCSRMIEDHSNLKRAK